MNPNGNPLTLRSSQPGNTNAVRHGAFSRRALEGRAREVAEALLEAPHTTPLDRVGAEELGALVALIEAIDDDLSSRGLTNRKGEARSLLELRIRASGRLERWLKEFGATPASRVDWVETMRRGSAVVEVVREELA